MDKYVCTVCGWIYDPAVGDPENGIAPVHHLLTSPKTGSALNAELGRICLNLNLRCLQLLFIKRN